MPRDADSLKIEKWAANGNVVDPATEGIDRAEGWGVDYSTPGGKLPTREVFNELEREITALGVEINRRGCGLEWDATISYLHPAVVAGSDDQHYRSVADSTGVDPVTDTTNSKWQRRLQTIISIAEPAADDWAPGDIWFQREE